MFRIKSNPVCLSRNTFAVITGVVLRETLDQMDGTTKDDNASVV